MDQGNIELNELRSRLRARRTKAWITAVRNTAQPEKDARLLMAQVVVGVRPPAWREQVWSYEECTFAVATSTTARLSSMVVSPGTHNLTVDSVDAVFELPETTFLWQGLPSLAPYSQLALPWPSTEFKLNLVNQQTLQLPNGYLVGRDEAPSFRPLVLRTTASSTGTSP